MNNKVDMATIVGLEHIIPPSPEFNTILKELWENYSLSMDSACGLMLPMLKHTPDGIRTHNPCLKRAVPYPLGHWGYITQKATGAT